MKNKNNFFNFCVISVCVFAIIGSTFIIIIIHEYMHKIDLQEYSQEEENICLLNLDFNKIPAIAYYEIDIDVTNLSNYEIERKKSELKASIVSVILLIVFYSIILLTIKEVFENE